MTDKEKTTAFINAVGSNGVYAYKHYCELMCKIPKYKLSQLAIALYDATGGKSSEMKAVIESVRGYIHGANHGRPMTNVLHTSDSVSQQPITFQENGDNISIVDYVGNMKKEKTNIPHESKPEKQEKERLANAGEVIRRSIPDADDTLISKLEIRAKEISKVSKHGIIHAIVKALREMDPDIEIPEKTQKEMEAERIKDRARRAAKKEKDNNKKPTNEMKKVRKIRITEEQMEAFRRAVRETINEEGDVVLQSGDEADGADAAAATAQKILSQNPIVNGQNNIDGVKVPFTGTGTSNARTSVVLEPNNNANKTVAESRIITKKELAESFLRRNTKVYKVKDFLKK